MNDPYAPAASNVDVQKKALLEAMATGGSAGKKAFEEARTRTEAMQQTAVGDALARARAVNAPPGAEGTEIQSVYGRRLADLSGAEADFTAYGDRMNQASQRYLDQLRAALPVMQASQEREYSKKKADTEGEIARRRSDMEHALGIAQKRMEERQRLAESEALEKAGDRAWERESRAHTRAGWAREDTKASKVDLPGLDELLGAAVQAQPAVAAALPGLVGSQGKSILGGPRMKIGGGPGVGQIPAQQIDTPNVTDLAFQLGQLSGVPANTLYGLYAPGKQSALVNAQQNLAPPPPKDDVAKSLAGKYATKGVDEGTARTILDNKDFQEAVRMLTSLDPATTNQTDQDNWLRQNFLLKGKTRTYEVLRGEYLSRFPQKKK